MGWYENECLKCTSATSRELSRPTLSQVKSFKIRLSKLLSCIKFVDRRILRLLNCGKVGRVVLFKSQKSAWNLILYPLHRFFFFNFLILHRSVRTWKHWISGFVFNYSCEAVSWSQPNFQVSKYQHEHPHISMTNYHLYNLLISITATSIPTYG